MEEHLAPGCMVDGDPAAPLLIIGIAPRREEIAQGKPFLGGSGKLLWKQLAKKAGISRADCRIVNVIGEWPEGIDGNPTKTQIDKYWEAFDEAVSCSKAVCAILLGGAALVRFAGLSGGIESWRGYLVARNEAQALTRTATREGQYKTNTKLHKKGDPKIEKVKLTVLPPWPETVKWAIPTVHPEKVLLTGFALLPAFAADIARVGRALRGELDIQEPKWTDGLPSNSQDGVSAQAPTVVDIETGGIDNDIITRIGATNGAEVWTALWDGLSRDALRDSLAGSRPSIAFNIGFDAPRLAKHGAPLPEPWWDVMLAAATLKPELKKSLNYVASLYLDKQRHKHLSDSNPAFYNAMDVSDTLRLYYILKAELERTGMLNLFEKRMMPTVPVLVDMTTQGIPVDIEVRDQWISSLQSQRLEVFSRWEGLAPGQKTSGKNLLNWLWSIGIPVQYSKHGGETSEVSALKKLLLTGNPEARQREVIETLIQLRQIEKELRTYAEVDLFGDGRVHPGFLPAGKDDDAYGKGIAGTGRITSSRPNIQNQPQLARRMFVPSNGGSILLEGDWSQIEARLMAEMADDDELRAAIAEGLHTSNMRVLGVDKTRAKNGFYGWCYGSGKRTLHNTFIGRGFNVSERECEDLLRGFDRRFVRTAQFRHRIAREVSTTYHLTNVFGRRRYFMGGSREVPAGLDFLPQSSAADIMWTVLRPLADSLREYHARILASVHDSILIECPRGEVAKCSKLMKDVMEQPWPELGGISVPIELKVGESWGTMVELPSHRQDT